MWNLTFHLYLLKRCKIDINNFDKAHALRLKAVTVTYWVHFEGHTCVQDLDFRFLFYHKTFYR